MIDKITFSPEEDTKKQEIKDYYKLQAGLFSTKQGLADFIWRKFFNIIASLEIVRENEKKAWTKKGLLLIALRTNTLKNMKQ